MSTIKKFLPRRSRQSGFALLIVLSLLGLLVLLLLSLASFTRVETNIASASQSSAQARQNALTALNLALGQLQRAAGPDKRVTATAANTLSNTYPLPNTEFAKNPYWTGVWDTNGGAPATFNNKFVQWLVNPANDAAAPRDLTNSNEPSANKLNLTNTTNGTNGSDGVINLVGTGTAGNANDGSVIAAPPQGEPGYNVPVGSRAQFIDLKLDNLQAGGLPGFAATDYRTFGRIAWWTSDDGVKASLSAVPRVNEVTYNLGVNTDDYRGASAGGLERQKRLGSLALQGSRADLALRNFAVPNDPVVAALNVGVFGAMGAEQTWPFLPRVDNLKQFTGAIRAVGNSNNFFGIGYFGGGGNDPSLTSSSYRRLDERLRERFHDLSPGTYSVLSDPVNGGLKADVDAYNGTTIPANLKGVADFSDVRIGAFGGAGVDILRSTIGLLQLVPPPSTIFTAVPPAPPEPVAVVGPIISECEIIVGLARTATGGINATLSGKVELWNPYNAVLTNPNNAGVDNWVLRVLAVDLANNNQFSDVELTDGVKVAPGVMSIPRLFGLTGVLGPYATEIPLDPPAVLPADIPPGRARTWSFNLAAVAAEDASETALSGFDNTSASSLNVAMPNASKLTVTLVRVITGVGGKKDEYHSVVDVPYVFAGAAAVAGGIRFHFRLRDAADFGIASPSWLGDYDPRGPRVYATNNAVDPSGNADPVASFGAGNFDTAGLIRDSTSGSSIPIPLFDLPRQNITSVGYLAQMPITAPNATSNAPVSRIGSAGTALNSLFDSYYFSSVPGDGTAWDPQSSTALPNTSLTVVNRLIPTTLADVQDAVNKLAKADSARFFLVKDTLNVNSVSETAWRSLLAGCLPGLSRAWLNSSAITAAVPRVEAGSISEATLAGRWDYVNAAGNLITENIANAYFRLPMTGAALEADYHTLKANLGGVAAVRERASYRLGVRELTNAQVDTMARRLVTDIMARNQPFGSVKDFVDSGLLQTAINAANINVNLQEFAPSYLTQADVLQAIGHRLVARSDTFTIRAYGESTNPALEPTDVNFVRGRAWVEAVVQRMPTLNGQPLATSAAEMADTGSVTGTDLGREFRVISLRWLTPNDL